MSPRSIIQPSALRRLAVVITLIVTVSTKLFCTLHIRGAMDYIPMPEIDLKPWTKIKQDIIERKGLLLLLNHPDRASAFLLQRDTAFGVCIYGVCVLGKDSALLSEIKISIDRLSDANDTLEVCYAYPNSSLHLLPFDAEGYKTRKNRRDSIDRVRSKNSLDFAKGLDATRYTALWYLSDTMLYHRAKCLEIFYFTETGYMLSINSVAKQYVAECKTKGYDPLLFDDIYHHTRNYHLYRDELNNFIYRLKNFSDDNDPEIQLLYKYVKLNDSIILSTPLSEDMYDLNYSYDHTKTANLSPLIYRRKPIRKYNDDDIKIDVTGLQKRTQQPLPTLSRSSHRATEESRSDSIQMQHPTTDKP